jgi:hypothetical protein
LVRSVRMSSSAPGVPRCRRLLLLALPPLLGVSVTLLPAAAAASATEIARTVLVNNSDKPWSVSDRNGQPCVGGGTPESFPTERFGEAPPPSSTRIVPGDGVTWTAEADTPGIVHSSVSVCADDQTRGRYDILTSLDRGVCAIYLVIPGLDPCSEQTDVVTHTSYYRLGPQVDPQVSVRLSKFHPGTPTTVTAQIGSATSAGSSLVPRGAMTFGLGPNGSGQCANVPVVGRTATCQATFTASVPQQITASYSGDFQFLPGSGTGTVQLAALVVAPYLPASGPDWESGAAPMALPFGNMPGGGTPMRLAASHDGKAVVAIGNTGQVYVRIGDPRQSTPDFYPLYNDVGQPMLGTAAAIDTDPVTEMVQLAVIGLDKYVWHRTLPAGGQWSQWGTPSPSYFQATDIALSIDNTGKAHFAAIGLDHNVNYRIRYTNSWDPWQVVRTSDGQAIQATRVAISAGISGPSAGAVELDYVGYGPGLQDHYVQTMSKAAGATSWSPPREVLVFNAAPFTSLAAGRTHLTINGVDTDLGLVAATYGSGAPVFRRLRTNSTWDSDSNSRINSGDGGVLTASATPDGGGIGFTTWQ